MKPHSTKRMKDDRLLDVKEAASILSVSPKTLYDWAYERRLPVVKLFGKALRFRLSVIQELINKSERDAIRSAGEHTVAA
jgi:excisionase family DNA binding protein